MKVNKIKLFTLLTCLLVLGDIYAQKQDSIAPMRDNIGDLNESAVSKGEFPGAIKLPGTDVSLMIGGFIKAVTFYDTKYNVKNEIILPGTFSPSDIYKGQTYIGARSSRLFFDGRATLGRLQMRGYYEMDFRGSPGFTLRHAYLQLSNDKGQKLLMGQYWSLVMDLLSIPEGLVEPTVSGGGFARHGQIRYTTPLSKAFTLSFSLEEPGNSDLKGSNIIPLNKYPDLIAALSIDPSAKIHFSLMGMFRPLTFATKSNDVEHSASGYLSSATIVLKPGNADKISVSGMLGSGASNYIMGGDGNAGYFDGTKMELQSEYGGFAAYRHVWNEKFRSNVALGIFGADEIINNPNTHIKSSTYGFINTYYRVNKYVNVGVEWIYTAKENYHGTDLNNNRFQFGIQVF